MTSRRVIVVGGGAGGVFSAIFWAEAAPRTELIVREKGPQFLSKVRISGGGRCNVTHACFDARELAARFPRGGQTLIGPFQRFQARDTVEWFEWHGVKLKTEEDGRMFPVTDSSQTIIDCLMNAAKKAGAKLVTGKGVEEVRKIAGGFELKSSCDLSHFLNTLTRDQLRTCFLRRIHQTINDRLRRIGDWKHSPILLRFQLHTVPFKPLDRIACLKSLKRPD